MATSKFPKTIFLTLVSLISSSLLIIAHAQLTYIHQSCYYAFGRYNFLSDYSDNIESAISALASKASTTYYSTHTAGMGDGKVNALYLCRYDVSPQVCQSCVASTANNISWCLGSVESLIAYEECSVHYSNRTIFAAMEELPQLYDFSSNSADNEFGFRQYLGDEIADLIRDTASTSRYFATKTAKYSSRETLYGLAQCNPDITSSECRTCLQTGFTGFKANHSSLVYGQIFMTSCRLSYILTSEEPKRPWRFAQTFDRDYGSGGSPSIGTRGSAIMAAMVAILSSLAITLKPLL